MRIAVFGADGFLGKHLVRRLSSQDDTYVRAFDRFSSKKDGSVHEYDSLENVEIIQGNFSNQEDVASTLEGIDYVFHLITTTTPASSMNDPFIELDTNIRDSLELFKLCSEMGVKKVIFFSSGGAVYGNVESDTIDESLITKPISPYAIGKVTVENYLRYFKSLHGLDYVVYRIANPYGPGQNIHGKQGVIPIFMRHFLTNEPITIFGDGEMVRDYIYIDDLVSMVVGSFTQNNLHEVYNIGSGEGRTVNDIVKIIQETSGIEPIKNSLPTPVTYVNKSVLSNDLFVNEFHISPQISLEVGIERTWDYVKEIK